MHRTPTPTRKRLSLACLVGIALFQIVGSAPSALAARAARRQEPAAAAAPSIAAARAALVRARAAERRSPDKAHAEAVDAALSLYNAAVAASDGKAGDATNATNAVTTQVSEVESNNTAATANALDTSAQGVVIATGAISPAGDVDYYSFTTTTAGARAWLYVDTGGTQAGGANSRDSLLTLYSTDGTTVLESDDDDGTGNGCDGTTESLAASAIGGTTLGGAGTYFVRVSSPSGSAVINPYKLFAVVTTVAPTPESEPNGTVGTADTILVGTGGTGVASGAISSPSDDDFYAAPLTAGDTLYVNLDGDPERDGVNGDIFFEIRTPVTNSLALSVDSSTAGTLSNPPAEAACYTATVTGTYNVRVRHKGGSSGTGTYSLMVTVGSVPCSITCPTNITTNATAGQCGATVTFATPTTTGSCGTVTCTPASGTFFSVGTTTVNCSDPTVGSCSFTVTVDDNQNPTVACPSNITTSAAGGSCSAVVTYTTPSGSDNCGIQSVSCLPASGSTFSVGTTTVTCTATDVNGRTGTCSFTVTVNDTQDPTLTCPGNITTAAAAGTCGAVVTYTTPTGSDNCGSASVSCLPASGSTFSVGTTTVTCTATDAGGRTGTCSFTVTVNDTQDPTLTCPGNITTSAASGSCSAVVNYTTPSGSDNCGIQSVSCLPASGSTFSVGTTTVTCTATDVNGRTGTCSFSVTVNDTQNPTVACPSDITTTAAQGQCSAVVTYTTPSGSDNCGIASVVCAPASGSTFSLGTTTVTCTATDVHGLTGGCSFSVTVNDPGSTGLVCPSDITTDATIAEGCTAGATVTYTTPAPPTGGCAGQSTVSCEPVSGSFFTVGETTVTCTATDSSQNVTATCTFTVTVNGVEGESLTCPAPISAVADSAEGCALGADIDFDLPENPSGCANLTSVECFPAPGSFFPVGDTEVTCSLLDDLGNVTQSCTFAVSVALPAGTVCLNDEFSHDSFYEVVDATSLLYGFWNYHVFATGEDICGTANRVNYRANRSLISSDNNYSAENPFYFMSANVNLGGKNGTVVVSRKGTSRKLTLRDRNMANNPPCGQTLDPVRQGN